ncbi:hypothetical protein [Flavobacterium noncentrifugens]|uniref:DoxX protein n=1 Tax=Flavobacterium noncentrifugens TaxID=1128970 RepID=A0A1G8S6E5_9FLAO|nr:hypothetical protein [Flavobacterium noncentrifugens]SDJ24753.1 hypothetical protein SAMN04487935_0423 [Flavobacterium noncentrifugens]
MEKQFQLFLRLALSASYLSAVSDRFGYWGAPGTTGIAWGNWENFVNYTNSVVGFLPQQWGGFLAIAATVLEIILPVLLIVGYRLKYISMASGLLLLGFALAMTFSFGIKTPLDYSVFTAAVASFLLSTISPAYSIDNYLAKRRN